jgi:DNA adenine methylase
MLIESKGKVIPQSVAVPIDRRWRMICREEAARRQARDQQRSDEWGKGLIEQPHYVGLLAECAVADMFGLQVDFSYGYDCGYDIKLHGLKIDVKGTYGDIPLIKQQKRKRCHSFIFAKVEHVEVLVLGWISYELATSKTLVKSKRKDATHMNYDVTLDDLRDINELKISHGANLLRYPGGKARLWNGKLERLMPSGSMFCPNRYVEPMVGGGGACMQALTRCEYREIFLADIDRSLVDLWIAVRDKPKQLTSMVQRWVPNIEDWYKAKANDGAIGNVLESAFNKLVLHYCSHGGIGFRAGGPQGGADQDSQYPIGCRWNPHRISMTIRHISKLIKRAHVECCDFSDIVLVDGDFVFADPPYVTAGESLYKHPFSDCDHRRLRDWLSNSPAEWVVTYDDCELVRQLYAGYQMLSVENSSGNNASKTELFITSEKDSGR